MEGVGSTAVGDGSASRAGASRDPVDQARIVLGALSEVIVEVDVQGRLRWVSPSCTLTLGYTPSQMIGAHAAEFVHPDDVDRLVEYRDALSLVSGRLRSPEVRIRTAEGDHRWMWIECRPVREGSEIVGLVASLRDAQDEIMLRRAVRTLSAASGMLVRATDELELLRAMCQTAVDEGGYLFAWYGRKQHDDGSTVRPIARSREHATYVDGIVVTWSDGEHGQGPSGAAIRLGTTQVVRDITAARGFAPWLEPAITHGFRSSIGVPVVIDGEVDGAFSIYAAEADAFDDRAIATLEDLAAELGYGIQRLREREQLDRAFAAAIDLLAAVVESRDPYTSGHQASVARLAEAIGREMGLDEHRLAGIHYGARVHDIGKVAVPIEILTYPGKLDDEQMAIVREHTNTGWEIANRFDWPWPIADMIRQHHERMDGSGYPLGLRGDEIRLESRIVAVADVYEAVAADRPYRRSMGAEKSWDLIVSGRGTVFDPDVVDALERVLASGFTLGD